VGTKTGQIEALLAMKHTVVRDYTRRVIKKALTAK
jgi:hypothetical protein